MNATQQDQLMVYVPREKRASFSIALLGSSVGPGPELAESLKAVGFTQAHFVSPDAEERAALEQAPPHVLVLQLLSEEQLAEEVGWVRSLSHETQIILCVELQGADADLIQRQVLEWAQKYNVGDVLWLPASRAAAESTQTGVRFDENTQAIRSLRLQHAELAVDRACRRLLLQFEMEYWRDRAENSPAPEAKAPAPPSLEQAPEASQELVAEATQELFAEAQQSLQSLSQQREFEPLIQDLGLRLIRHAKLVREIVIQQIDPQASPIPDALSRTDGFAYLKWLPVQMAFNLVSYRTSKQNLPLAMPSNLGLTLGRRWIDLLPPDAQEKASSADLAAALSSWQPLREFLRDVLKLPRAELVLHGRVEQPLGVIVLSPLVSTDAQLQSLLANRLAPWTQVFQTSRELIIQSFDLAWTRQEAVRDRHATARVDRVTGLLNDTALQEALTLEIARARRLHHSLTVVMLKLDAPVTDEVAPRVMATAFKRILRNTDVVARLPGGRFVILLTHTGSKTGAQVIERLIRICEKIEIPGRVGHLKLRAGVIEFPSHTSKFEDLLQLVEDLIPSFTSQELVAVAIRPMGFVPEYLPLEAVTEVGAIK
ncbi:MAG TPA: diguanylate cyclase [Pseudobdellovibrionaceae bacterium]|nr:diguanylate cyclase [Pseudobdellovibrionaceae bacterium]